MGGGLGVNLKGWKPPRSPPVINTSSEQLLHFPTVCVCGNPIKFSNEERCEECFAFGAHNYHGRSQRVEYLPDREIRELQRSRHENQK